MIGPGRTLKFGLRRRLEVFRKGPVVGWGLRTLEAISKGELVMEYCGEHVSSTGSTLEPLGDAAAC